MTTLTMRDEKRLKIIERVFRGEVTVAQAALVMGVSEITVLLLIKEASSGSLERARWPRNY